MAGEKQACMIVKSFDSGAILVVGCSALVTGLWRILLRDWTAWLVAFLAPFVLASLLYWLAAHHGDSAEHSAWAALFINGWGVAGVLASSVTLGVVIIIGRVLAKRRHTNEQKQQAPQ
jgi:hypothetical protein